MAWYPPFMHAQAYLVTCTLLELKLHPISVHLLEGYGAGYTSCETYWAGGFTSELQSLWKQHRQLAHSGDQ